MAQRAEGGAQTTMADRACIRLSAFPGDGSIVIFGCDASSRGREIALLLNENSVHDSVTRRIAAALNME